MVYPLARGSPILLTAVGLQVLGVDDPLSPLAIVGMVVVISGVTFLCTEAFYNTTNNDKNDLDAVVLNPLSRSLDDEDSSHDDDSNKTFDENVKTQIEMFPKQKDNRGEDLSDTPHPDDEQISKSRPAPYDRWKLLKSISLAMAVGVCSASYSTIDALAVRRVPLLLFMFLVDVSSTLSLLPFLYKFHYKQTLLALKEHKLTILLISPCVTGSYLIILQVYSLFDVSIAVVIAVRTSSVLLGSFIGVMFLGEHYSVIKCSSIMMMFVGIIIIKFS